MDIWHYLYRGADGILYNEPERAGTGCESIALVRKDDADMQISKLRAQIPRTERFEIIHQQQPDSETCGQTCVAMLLGAPVADVIKVLGGQGMSRRDVYHAMERCRFWWNALLFEYTMLHGHYLAVVPSLNFEAEGHYVVIRKDENGETVFDPNRGREGKKFYGDGGVPVKMRESMVYVCKSGWCSNWYDGHLPAVQDPTDALGERAEPVRHD